MPRRSSRKGLFGTLYSPLHHTLGATKSSVNAVTNTAKGVVGVGLRGLNRVGRTVTNRANRTVGNLVGSVSRKNRRGTRRNRRNTRRNRRN